jgi:acyl-CoA dehydrogenase
MTDTARHPARGHELASRVGRFVREEIIPYERDPRWGAHGPLHDELGSRD